VRGAVDQRGAAGAGAAAQVQARDHHLVQLEQATVDFERDGHGMRLEARPVVAAINRRCATRAASAVRRRRARRCSPG
jgi:hypothetical protein